MDGLTDILIGIIGALIVACAWLVVRWITTGFERNDKEHTDIRETVKEVGKDVKTTSKKIDHVINYHDGIPPYKE